MYEINLKKKATIKCCGQSGKIVTADLNETEVKNTNAPFSPQKRKFSK